MLLSRPSRSGVFGAAGLRTGEHGEIRTEEQEVLSLVWRGRGRESATLSRQTGHGVRVRTHAGTCFAATTDPDPTEALRAARRGARTISAREEQAAEPEPLVADLCADDDGLVEPAHLLAAEEKAAFLEFVHHAAITSHPAVGGALLYYRESRRTVRLTTTGGTDLRYRHDDLTLQLTITALDGATTATGAVSLGSAGDFQVLRALPALAEQAARDAVDTLAAPVVDNGFYDVVCDGRLAGTWAHETLGHLAEADQLPEHRELAEPGHQVGSRLLTVTDGPGRPGARGFVPVDDEGITGTEVVLLDRGRSTGAGLHTRTTAAQQSAAATGNARAVDYRHAPIPRLRTVSIAPGPHDLAEMIGGTGRGLWAAGFYGGQTDRRSFTFMPETCWLIDDGRRSHRVRAATLTGDILAGLAAVDRVGDTPWTGDTSAGCGKHGQWPLPVSSWAPPIRLRGLHVRAG